MEGDPLFFFLVNPWRACAARVTVLGLSVHLSVHLLPCFLLPRAANRRHQRVQRYTGFILKMAIFVEVLRSEVMA